MAEALPARLRALADFLGPIQPDIRAGVDIPQLLEAAARALESNPTMLAALLEAEWMLARDFIDPQKSTVLHSVQDAIRKAGGEPRYG